MAAPGRARAIVAIAALAAIAVALWKLEGSAVGVSVTRERIGAIPATVFRPAGAGALPVVVIAHGFAGSQQLMLPFAITLARNGYAALTFDFPGHGRHREPLAGGLEDPATC